MAYKSMFVNSKEGGLSELEISRFLSGSQKIASDRTRISYQGALRRFQVLLSELDVDVNQVQSWHIEQFAERIKQAVNYRTRKPGVSDSTVLLNLSAVSSYYNWRQQTGRSDRNPVKQFRFRRSKCPQVVIPITPQVAKTMCRLSPDKKKIAALRLLWRSGVRVAELVRMNKDSIEIETLSDQWQCGIVYVVGKGRKRRRAYVSPDALDAIAAYLAERGEDSEPALFISRLGRRASVRTIQRWIKAMAAAAGDDHGHPHRLRHLFSSEMAAGGMPERDLMDRLGHEDNSTTYRYIDVSEQNLIARCTSIWLRVRAELAASH